MALESTFIAILFFSTNFSRERENIIQDQDWEYEIALAADQEKVLQAQGQVFFSLSHQEKKLLEEKARKEEAEKQAKLKEEDKRHRNETFPLEPPNGQDIATLAFR